MATNIGDRRVCASCGTQVIVTRESEEGFAVMCCGQPLEQRVAGGAAPATPAPATPAPTTLDKERAT